MERKKSNELCSKCGRQIEYIKPLNEWIKRMCDCERAERKEELKCAAEKAREYIRTTYSGIPKRYLGKTFDSYIPRTKAEKTLKAWGLEFAERNYENTGLWFIILGTYGVGKTHISTAIMNKVIDTMEIDEQTARGFLNGYTDNVPKPCRYVRCTDLIDGELDRIRSGNNSGTDYEAICKYTPLLVLDDFGVTKPTDWNKELFYRILDYRYINELPTVISTNLTQKELKEALGARSYDRLKEMSKKPLSVDGSSYRGN